MSQVKPDSDRARQTPAAAFSWLTLAEPDAHIQAQFDAAYERLGYVPNALRVTAHRPDLAQAQNALGRATARAEQSTLSVLEREVIALVVSSQNRCDNCIYSHVSKLSELTGDPVWAARLEINYRRVDLEPRLRAIADYALKLTRFPETVERSDLDVLREHGLSEEQLIDVVGVVGYFNFSNRLSNALGVVPNSEVYKRA